MRSIRATSGEKVKCKTKQRDRIQAHNNNESLNSITSRFIHYNQTEYPGSNPVENNLSQDNFLKWTLDHQCEVILGTSVIKVKKIGGSKCKLVTVINPLAVGSHFAALGKC